MRTPAVRVLHIATRYRRGGSEQRIRDLLAALDDADHSVLVGADSDLSLAQDQLGVPVAMVASLVRAPRPDLDLCALVQLARVIRREAPTIVVTHQSKAGAVGRLAARLAGGVPVVHSLSMANFGPGFGRAEGMVFRVVERLLAPATSRYVVVGADLARRFEVAGIPAHKLTIVRSAAALPAECPTERPSLPAVPDGRPVVLCLGALESRKNPLDLVPLLARVQETVPDAFLAIAGDGPLAGDLGAAIARAGLASDGVLLGYVKPVEPLLWRADVVVLLSDAEGLPQVLIQAAAAGTPFVSYDVDGAREVVALGAEGSVVPLGDVEAAAAAIVRLLRAGAPRRRRADLASWDRAVIHRSYRAVISEVAEGGRRAG